MKYFAITIGSTTMCGFETVAHIKAESEEALTETIEYNEFVEDMQDYIDGWVDDLESDTARELDYGGIEEVSKEEFEEYKGWTI